MTNLDTSNILGSIEALPDQIQDAWNQVMAGEIPDRCSLAKNVVIAGMGGSALGGRIADSLIFEKARSSIEVFTEVSLPNYVNQDTLVILSSYSGNTQETLICAQEALNRGAVIFGITTGGKLAEFLHKNNLDAYIINPTHNPSNQPRMGLGYAITATLAVLARCGFINLLESEISEAVAAAKKELTERQTAKDAAKFFQDGIPVLIASEHLVGVAHAFRNQLNENAKTFGLLFDLPEMNHHLLEGLARPESLRENLKFLFFESSYYHKEVQKRYPLAREVIEKQGFSVQVHKFESARKLPQIFESLVFGSLVSFYLAELYQIDPGPIPWVDYFKERLAKS